MTHKIYLVGLMGVGKSSIGLKAALESGLPFADMDDLIIKGEKRSISAIFNESGEQGFRKLEKSYLNNIDFGDQPFGLVSTGGGTPAYFDNSEFMKANGTMVWLDTPLEIIAARLREEQEHRPLLKDVPGDELMQSVKILYNQREPFYSQASYRIENSGYDYEAVNELKKVISEIIEKHTNE